MCFGPFAVRPVRSNWLLGGLELLRTGQPRKGKGAHCHWLQHMPQRISWNSLICFSRPRHMVHIVHHDFFVHRTGCSVGRGTNGFAKLVTCGM